MARVTVYGDREFESYPPKEVFDGEAQAEGDALKRRQAFGSPRKPRTPTTGGTSNLSKDAETVKARELIVDELPRDEFRSRRKKNRRS